MTKSSALILVGAFASAVLWPRPASPSGDDFFMEHCKRVNELIPGRLNGARMTTEATVAEGKDGERLVLKWMIDYNGPRPPLIILRPSFNNGTDQTGIFVSAPVKSPVVVTVRIIGDIIPGPATPARRDMFLTIQPGQSASGEVSVPVSKVKEFFQKKAPGQFENRPASVFVHLDHRASERGERFGLDAWTGALRSKGQFVTFKSW